MGRWMVALTGLVLTTAAGKARAAPAKGYLGKPHAWFRSKQERRIQGNILSRQFSHGGWPGYTDQPVGFSHKMRGSSPHAAQPWGDGSIPHPPPARFAEYENTPPAEKTSSRDQSTSMHIFRAPFAQLLVHGKQVMRISVEP